MPTPVWGLQAAISSKHAPFDIDAFLEALSYNYTAMGMAFRMKLDKLTTKDVLADIVIACYRLANMLDIVLDDEVRNRLK